MHGIGLSQNNPHLNQLLHPPSHAHTLSFICAALTHWSVNCHWPDTAYQHVCGPLHVPSHCCLGLTVTQYQCHNKNNKNNKRSSHMKRCFQLHEHLFFSTKHTHTKNKQDQTPSNGSCPFSSLHLQVSCPAPPESRLLSLYMWLWRWGDSCGLLVPRCGERNTSSRERKRLEQI